MPTPFFAPGASRAFLPCPGFVCRYRGIWLRYCRGELGAAGGWGRRGDGRGQGGRPGVAGHRGLGEGARTALTAAGTEKIRTGELVAFCKLVAIVPAVVRRDGRVQAAGHPADHARLGVLEEQLDEMAGPGTIDELAKTVRLAGKVKGTARRAMTTALALRAVLLMTLMPGADYTEVMTALLGDLAGRPVAPAVCGPVPGGAIGVAGRDRPALAERLQAMVLAAACAEHDEHDYRAVHVGDLRLGSIDGTVTRMPDTPANRAAFGSTGTGDDSAPYPQLRGLLISDASTRGALGVVTGRGRGQGRSRAEAAGQGAARVPAPVHAGPVMGAGQEFPRRGADQENARHRHPRADPRQKRYTAPAGGRVPAGRLLPGGTVGGGVTLTVRVIEYLITVARRMRPSCSA